MKRKGNFYQEVIKLENIEAAIYEAAKNKKRRQVVKRVLANPTEYALKVQELLLSRDFSLNVIYKDLNDKKKKRTIEVGHFYPNQIIHHAVMRVLEPYFKKIIHPNSFSHFSGRGIDFGIKKSRKYAQKYPMYLKFDLKKFYENIDLTRLMGVLKRKIKDKYILEVIECILGVNEGKTRGISIGSYFSGIIANVLLYLADHKTSEITIVTRYADDYVLWGGSKKQLWRAYRVLETYLSDLELRAHKLNLADISWRGKNKGSTKRLVLDFLGVRICRFYTTPRTRTIQRIKELQHIKYVGPKQYSCIMSYYGFSKRCKCYTLFRKVLTEKLPGSKTSLLDRMRKYCKRTGIRFKFKGYSFIDSKIKSDVAKSRERATKKREKNRIEHLRDLFNKNKISLRQFFCRVNTKRKRYNPKTNKQERAASTKPKKRLLTHLEILAIKTAEELKDLNRKFLGFNNKCPF